MSTKSATTSSLHATGVKYGETTQYRGIQYATLDNAFSEPQVRAYPYGDDVNAKAFGPSAVSLPNACEMEQGLIQHTLPHEPFDTSETDCLNLNITTPATAPVKDGLPVFVFFHGGGFMMGSNVWPQYDLSRTVGESVVLKKPVIAVGVSYRLGPAGFLTSQELRDAGYKANNGLRDQRTALLWVQRYIHVFGGDPARVTVVGESAGGVSCFLHLQSPEPLFTQLVSMSGNPLTMKPIPLAVAESTYTSIVNSLGLAEMTTEERVKAILGTPLERLAPLAASLPLIPTLDGKVLVSGQSYEKLNDDLTKWPGTQWCRSLMIGDCQFDGSIMTYQLIRHKTELAQIFKQAATAALENHPSLVETILSTYGISSAATSDAAFKGVLDFATDILFYASTMKLAQSWPGAAYVYHFNEPNPWDGPYKGEATHILDIAFLFQNYNEYLSDEQRATAKAFAGHLITFVHGEEPYERYDANRGGAMVYGPPVQPPGFVIGLDAGLYGRRREIFDIAGYAALDVVARILDEVMAR